MRTHSAVISLLLLGVTTLHVPAAAAETRSYSAVAVCEAPLPVYDVQLRKRPTGIRNESDLPIFISCSLHATAGSSSRDVIVNFASAAGAGPVSCTLAAGRVGTLNYTTKAVSVPAGGSAFMQFALIPISGVGSYNLSCQVPAQFEINYLVASEA